MSTTPDPWADPNAEPKPLPAVSIHLHTSDYRGDHAADIEIAVAAELTDTIEDIVRRSQLDGAHDFLTIRLVTR